jgi:hypothetical protein
MNQYDYKNSQFPHANWKNPATYTIVEVLDFLRAETTKAIYLLANIGIT